MVMPPAAATLDSGDNEGLDIVEIMRRRRMQETGEAPPQNGDPVEVQGQQEFQGETFQGGEIRLNEAQRGADNDNPPPAGEPGSRFRPQPEANEGRSGDENDGSIGNDNTNRSDED